MLNIKLIVLFILPFLSNISAQNEIVGKYHLPNKLDIEIFEYKSKYYGRIIALNGYEDGQTVDYKNPKKEKRHNLLLGKIIITNIEYDAVQKEWINGTMYGPEKGVFFDFKIKDARENEIEIVASKYLFWKTLQWERI